MLVDTISKVKNVTFDATNLDAYVTSLRGLSATQAKVVLSSTSLDKVQQKQILNKLAETTATVSLTSAEATEALTRKLGSEQAAKGLLTKAGLVTEKELETGVTIALKKELIDEAVLHGLITKEEGKQILATFGLEGANIGLATSFKLLAKNAWAFFTTTPAGWATLAIGAIVGVTIAVVNYNKKLEENRQEMIEAGKEAAQLTKDLDGLVEQYRKLGEDGKLDNSDREQAYDIQQQINELLGDEVDYIDLANGKYEDQLELLKKLQHQKANDKWFDIKDAKTSAEESLVDNFSETDGAWKQIWGVTGFSTTSKRNVDIMDEILDANPELKDFVSTDVYKYKSDRKKSSPDKFTSSVSFRAQTDNAEEILLSYEKMVDLRQILEKSYKKEIDSGGALEDFYKNLCGQIDDMAESITKYKEAISDYNINQAVITFNETEFDVEGLGKIKGAFINSEEAMSGWITSMINAEDVSDGVQVELIALAQTWYPQYTKQINEAVEAEAKKVAQDAIADKSLAGNIQGLKNEASALGITEGAMIELVLAEIRFNKNNLNVSQKISALKELAVWAGVAEKKMDSIFSVTGKSSMKNKEIWAERNGVTINYNADEDGSHSYTYKGETYSGVDKVNAILVDEAIQEEIDKLGKVTTSGDDPGGGSGSGSSYSDFYDEMLDDNKKAREHFEQENEKNQKKFEKALEGDSAEEVEKISKTIAENAKTQVAELNKQFANEQKNLNEEILPLIYGIAPGLKKKDGWGSVTEVEKEKVRNKLTGDLLDKFNSLVETADEWTEDLKEIPGLIEDINEEADTTEDKNDFLNDLFSKYKEHIQRQTDELQKQADAYDILINKAQARADGEKSMYESLRKVRELQRDISKELATNKAMGEYLDEDTRRLLFNEDDYGVLDKKLKSISSSIKSLGSWYNNKISGLDEDEWYLEEAITKEYERRLEAKEKEYEIARAELDIEKKKLELNNILNEKNIRMLTRDDRGNYSWQYVHDVEAASKVVGEIAELEGEISETRLQASEDSLIGVKQQRADLLNQEKVAIENRIKVINEETEELARVVENITDPLTDFGTVFENLCKQIEFMAKQHFGIVLGGSKEKKKSGGKSTGISGGNNSTPPSNMDDFQKQTEDKLSEAVIELNLHLENNGDVLDNKAKGLQREIDNLNARLKRIDDDDDDKSSPTNGARPVFDQGGSAYGKGIMFKDTEYEEIVLNPDQTDYFKRFIENTDGFDIVARQMSSLIGHQIPPVKENVKSEQNAFYGDIILPSVHDPEDFMVELKKHLQQNSFRNI